HLAITTVFDIAIVHCDQPPRRNFRAADWKEFSPVLSAHLVANPLPPLPLTSPAQIDAYTDAFTAVMTSAIAEHVPLSRPSPYSCRWWCAALKILR
ncbi:hypothetical protein FB451DRAFT_965976, partial [Mycena latifolia]